MLFSLGSFYSSSANFNSVFTKSEPNVAMQHKMFQCFDSVWHASDSIGQIGDRSKKLPDILPPILIKVYWKHCTAK